MPAGDPGGLVEQILRGGVGQPGPLRPGQGAQGEGQRGGLPGLPRSPDQVGGDRPESSGIRHNSLVDTPGVYHKFVSCLYFLQRTNFRRTRQPSTRPLRREKPGHST